MTEVGVGTKVTEVGIWEEVAVGDGSMEVAVAGMWGML